MQPDETHLDDLTRVYEGAFSKHITREEARDLYARLLDLYERIKRVPREWHDEQTGEPGQEPGAAG